MTQNDRNNGNSEEADDTFAECFTYILAGFEANLDRLDINGFSLQRLGDFDYRVVLRATDRSDSDNPLSVVSFTNSDTPFGCLYALEGGLRSGKIKFIADRYAAKNSNGSAAKVERTGFRLIE